MSTPPFPSGLDKNSYKLFACGTKSKSKCPFNPSSNPEFKRIPKTGEVFFCNNTAWQGVIGVPCQECLVAEHQGEKWVGGESVPMETDQYFCPYKGEVMTMNKNGNGTTIWPMNILLYHLDARCGASEDVLEAKEQEIRQRRASKLASNARYRQRKIAAKKAAAGQEPATEEELKDESADLKEWTGVHLGPDDAIIVCKGPVRAAFSHDDFRKEPLFLGECLEANEHVKVLTHHGHAKLLVKGPEDNVGCFIQTPQMGEEGEEYLSHSGRNTDDIIMRIRTKEVFGRSEEEQYSLDVEGHFQNVALKDEPRCLHTRRHGDGVGTKKGLFGVAVTILKDAFKLVKEGKLVLYKFPAENQEDPFYDKVREGVAGIEDEHWVTKRVHPSSMQQG